MPLRTFQKVSPGSSSETPTTPWEPWGFQSWGTAGVHGLDEVARFRGGAVAADALRGVDVGAGEEVGGGGLDGGGGELAVDAGGERDVNDLAFEGEGPSATATGGWPKRR